MATDLSIKYSAFPSDFESLDEKKTDRYGLEYVRAIWSSQLINYPANNPTILQYFINREFAEGTYNTGIYKPRLGLDGDTSFLNLDLASINRIPTIIDNMVGKMTNKPWRFQCNPTDTVSRTKFDDKRAEMKADAFLKNKSDETESLTGVPLVQKGKFIPEDNEEMELYMQMNFKLEEAEAMELALKWVFDNNNFEMESVPLLYRDIFTDKKTVIYRYYDANKNIKVKRWDHLKLITPYSNKEDFSDVPYQALTNTYTIGAIAKMNPSFTDEQLYNIAKNNAGQLGNALWNTDWFTAYSSYQSQYGAIAYRQFQNFNINVVNFYFLSPIHTTKAVKISKTGRMRVEDKKEGYVNEKGIEIINKRKLVRFEGFWIPGSDTVWGYKRTENEDRDIVVGAYSPETELPCKIIMPNQLALKNKSMVQRMIPFEKQLCLAWYKLQQFLIEAMPPGIAINQNALLEVVEGAGEGKPLPTDWTKLYKQTGNIIFTDKDAAGNPINIPFKELEGGISSAFEQFLKVMDYCIGKMNEVVGYNTAVDASSPKSDALVGVNQMAQAATYDCLRPCYLAVTNLIQGSGKRVGLMIQDSLRLGNEDFKKALTDAIGKANVDILIEGREYPFSASAISVEIQPDEHEIADLNVLIQLGIENQMLTPSDVLRVRQQMKTNIKLAGQLLVYLEKKNSKEKQKLASQNIQETAQAQAQSGQAAAQAQAQLDEILTVNKIKVEQAKCDMDIQKMQIQGGIEENIQKLRNIGTVTAAEIGATAHINVQEAANRGKVVATQVVGEMNIAKQHVIHESNIEQTHLEHESEIQRGFQDHDHKKEQIELEAKLTPKPVASKK